MHFPHAPSTMGPYQFTAVSRDDGTTDGRPMPTSANFARNPPPLRSSHGRRPWNGGKRQSLDEWTGELWRLPPETSSGRCDPHVRVAIVHGRVNPSHVFYAGFAFPGIR
jgi:hypothetical protein